MAYCSELDSTAVWTHRTLDTFEEDLRFWFCQCLYMHIGFSLLLDPTKINHMQRVLLWLARRNFFGTLFIVTSMGQAQSPFVSSENIN